MKSVGKPLVLLVLAALVATVVAVLPSSAEEPHQHTDHPSGSHGRWSPSTVDLFARLPVQDGGRVKPLSTFAKFTLLSLNGKSGCKTPDGRSLSPTEWLMDCMFFPDEATKYDCFVVEDSEVLDAVGLAHEGKNRRDRYSYSFLAEQREQIFSLARQYAQIDEKSRNVVQGQMLNLANNIGQFEAVAGLLISVGNAPHPGASPALTKVFGKGAAVSLADVVDRAQEIRPLLAGGDDPHAAMGPHGSAAGQGGDEVLSGWIEQVVSGSRGLALIPPAADAGANAEWLSPSDVVSEALFHGKTLKEQTNALRELESMALSRDDDKAFRDHAQTFSNVVVTQAQTRGEYGKIPLEVTYYRADFFYYSQMVFVLAFLFAAFSWIKPTRFLTRGAVWSVIVATLVLAAGITMRCIIRGRPPVSTLYESILFTTAVAVIASMVAEYVNRKGIATGLAAVLGSAGMFLANRYEVQEHVDTMPSLVAVLDTNFWLASHVTTVTIGYGAGLLAGAIGHVYVLGKVFGLKKGDTAFYKTLSSMTYGMLCFGLLFSVVGTVLGGIWANESWGRFWGWDPKENGALTIVLWELIILHARMGGYIRDFGIAMASVFGAAVVAASWWGVNLLGVGLHSYGFTSGILIALLSYFAFEAVVLAAGGLHWWLRGESPAAPVAGGAPPLPPVA